MAVLGDDNVASLIDRSTGQALATANAPPGADVALPLPGGLAAVQNGRVFFNGRDIGAGTIIGAGKLDAGRYAFAVSDGVTGRLFTLSAGTLKEGFTFPVSGKAEAYFTMNHVFVSPLHGVAVAYSLVGKRIRDFSETGGMAGAYTVGSHIAVDFVSTDSGRFTLLLDMRTLGTLAYLPGLMGEAEPGRLIVDGGAAGLRLIDLQDARELAETARERLDGRVLSADEKKTYKAE